MRNEASVEIDRRIDEVFRLTTDHVAEWSIIVVEDEVLDEKPEGVGTTFRTVTEDHGKRMEFQRVVTQHDPPYAHAIRLTGDMFDIEAAYAFEDLSGWTRVTQTSNVTGKGFFRLFLFLFGWLMNKSSCTALENELNSLKSRRMNCRHLVLVFEPNALASGLFWHEGHGKPAASAVGSIHASALKRFCEEHPGP